MASDKFSNTFLKEDSLFMAPYKERLRDTVMTIETSYRYHLQCLL